MILPSSFSNVQWVSGSHLTDRLLQLAPPKFHIDCRVCVLYGDDEWSGVEVCFFLFIRDSGSAYCKYIVSSPMSLENSLNVLSVRGAFAGRLTLLRVGAQRWRTSGSDTSKKALFGGVKNDTF